MAPLPDDISPSGVSYADLLKTATYWAGSVRLSDVPSTDVDWLWPRPPKSVLHGLWIWKLPDQMRKNRGGGILRN